MAYAQEGALPRNPESTIALRKLFEAKDAAGERSSSIEHHSNLSSHYWHERIYTGRSLPLIVPLFESEAERATRVFDGLKLADMPGTPTMTARADDWPREIDTALRCLLNVATMERFIHS